VDYLVGDLPEVVGMGSSAFGRDAAGTGATLSDLRRLGAHHWSSGPRSFHMETGRVLLDRIN
jgi:hypothetical protein